MNTITLPDTISFEELARIWCVEWNNVLRFRYEVYLFSALKRRFLRETKFETLAIFYPLSRSFSYSEGESETLALSHIFSFIKERSNG